jgi:hypothetical protein
VDDVIPDREPVEQPTSDRQSSTPAQASTALQAAGGGPAPDGRGNDRSSEASGRPWTDYPVWQLLLLLWMALAAAASLYVAFIEDTPAVGVVLGALGLLALPLGAIEKLKNDPGIVVLLKMTFVVVVAAVTLSILLVRRPVDPLPVFDLGVDGIAVATDDSPPEIADWISESLADVDSFDGCKMEKTRVEVWSPTITRRADFGDLEHPTRADLLVDVRVSGPTSSGTYDVSLGLEPISVPTRTAGDPFVLDELRAEAASIDLDRHLGSNATSRFPELSVLPTVIAGLRELDDSTSVGLGRARCAFETARSELEQTDGHARGFLASLDVLIAATWIREARASDVRDDSLDSAAVVLERAHHLVATSDVPGVEPDQVALDVIEANQRGIEYLRLFDDDDSLRNEVNVETILATVADFEAATMDVQRAPAASVLVQTLTAKLWLAAAVEGQLRPDFAPPGERDHYLAQAEAAITRAIEAGHSVDDIAVAAHLADAYYTRGHVHAERREPLRAAGDYELAAAQVGGSLEQTYRLFQAVALRLGCDEQGAAAVLDDVARYLDDEVDAEVHDAYVRARSVSAPDCGPEQS